MVTSKIRVEITENVVKNDPFLGTFHHRKVYEDIIVSDKNQYEKPPCDVHCRFKTEYATIEVQVDRGYFDGLSFNGWGWADFIIGRYCYQLNVHFDAVKGEIIEATLQEWSDHKEFACGEDSDKQYSVESYIMGGLV